MSRDLRAAAIALAAVLARENEALARGDLARAAAMVAVKSRAARSFAQARPRAAGGSRRAVEPLLLADVGRLEALAKENRRLLEHALVVQSRVIGTLRSAILRSVNAHYNAQGALTPGDTPSTGLSMHA